VAWQVYTPGAWAISTGGRGGGPGLGGAAPAAAGDAAAVDGGEGRGERVGVLMGMAWGRGAEGAKGKAAV
jgi:hypothetical protein